MYIDEGLYANAENAKECANALSRLGSWDGDKEPGTGPSSRLFLPSPHSNIAAFLRDGLGIGKNRLRAHDALVLVGTGHRLLNGLSIS